GPGTSLPGRTGNACVNRWTSMGLGLVRPTADQYFFRRSGPTVAALPVGEGPSGGPKVPAFKPALTGSRSHSGTSRGLHSFGHGSYPSWVHSRGSGGYESWRLGDCGTSWEGERAGAWPCRGPPCSCC